MNDFDQLLRSRLEERQKQQRYRQRHSLMSSQGNSVVVDGKSYLNFSSNDYLGLADNPDARKALQQAADVSGVGSGASHLIFGHHDYHHQLELVLAEFTGRERALLFSTGYMANLGVITALTQRGDTIFSDRLNHASLIDAGILSRATVKRYHHNDLQHLEELLASASETGRRLVVVDGVFSMDGDIASLDQLSDLCEHYNAQLMVDDAHGFGVLGEQGGGCAEYFQLNQNQLPILMGTLGKACGTFGAFVAGSEALIETLIQFARPYIYTTALPPAIAAATLKNLEQLKQVSGKNLRQALKKNIHYFKERAANLSLSLMPSETAIQPIVLGDDKRVIDIADQLKQLGILVGAVRPPTVPEGSARLRITLSASHQIQEIDSLLESLHKLLKEEL